jgi:hypothetical protein
MINFIKNLRIKNLKRKGYDYYTITVDGVVESIIFYRGM